MSLSALTLCVLHEKTFIYYLKSRTVFISQHHHTYSYIIPSRVCLYTSDLCIIKFYGRFLRSALGNTQTQQQFWNVHTQEYCCQSNIIRMFPHTMEYLMNLQGYNVQNMFFFVHFPTRNPLRWVTKQLQKFWLGLRYCNFISHKTRWNIDFAA